MRPGRRERYEYGDGPVGGLVAVQCRRGWSIHFLAGCIAFGKQADALAKHQKGDLVKYAGQSVDGAGWRHPAGLSGTGRLRDQRQNGTSKW